MKNILFVFLVLILTSCDDGSEPYHPSGNGNKPVEVNVDCHKRAKEIFDLINSNYKVGGNNLYKENFPAQPGDASYSFLWPYDGLISGAATLTQLGYNVGYPDMVDAFEKYYRTGANGNTIGGYGSSTNGTTGGGTRFYDDNSIVGLSLLEAYHITKDDKYKLRAQRIVGFLKSGIDNELGGALWWNEDKKKVVGDENSNKPTCANGYATLFLLEYSLVCDASEKQDVLNVAKGLYDWLRANLYDSDSKCYWNDKNTQGQINRTIWTYNTAVMIQNGIRLYKITGEQKYLTEATTSTEGSYDYFVKIRNGISSYPDHDPWFNTKLLRAYIDMVPYSKNADTYIKTYYNFINNGYDKARSTNGFFREDWTGKIINAQRDASLLIQAAVVESYGALALCRKENINKD